MSVPLNGWSLREVRQDTPGCQKVVHLNNAGCALPPQRVLTTTEAFLRREALYGGYETLEAEETTERGVYRQLSRLLNCREGEVAILPSATSAWQQVLFGIQFSAGDVILTTPNEYGSNFINLLQLEARQGVAIHVVPEAENGDLDFCTMAEMMERLNPKLLALTHIPTSSGAVYDARRAGKLARESNTLYLLDACQSVGQMTVDVESIGCDFLSGTSRKFLRGPRGIGFLYAAEKTREHHEPAFLDVRSATWTSQHSYRPHIEATRYEQYELSFAAKMGFGVAVEYCLDLGMDWIQSRIQSLTQSLRQRLMELPKLRIFNPCSTLSGIVSFTVDGYEAEYVCAFLREHQINVSISRVTSTRLKFELEGVQAVIRASVHYYNNEQDLEALCEKLHEL